MFVKDDIEDEFVSRLPVIPVVNCLLNKAKIRGIKDLNSMKIQKLLFISHGWWIALTNKPLVDEYFCRWTYGPVIPSLYHKLERYGSNPVNSEIKVMYNIIDSEVLYTVQTVENKDVISLIDKVLDEYGKLSCCHLANICMQEDTAWYKYGKDDGSVILTEYIKEEFISYTR